MIKGKKYNTEKEGDIIKKELINRGISIWNISRDKNKKIITWFENEDYQNSGIGFKLI